MPCGEEHDSENDVALLLARIESKEPDKFAPLDEAGTLVSHHGGGWHFHLERTDVPGAYHFGVMISGTYTPSGFAPNDPMAQSVPVDVTWFAMIRNVEFADVDRSEIAGIIGM